MAVVSNCSVSTIASGTHTGRWVFAAKPACPFLQALAANAAALAAAAAGQNGYGGLNSGGMLNSMEYQAAYQVRCTLEVLHLGSALTKRDASSPGLSSLPWEAQEVTAEQVLNSLVCHRQPIRRR